MQMVNIEKHKLIMFQILKQIYSDIEIATWLGFKGGTALFFFYNLPRFSIDLDFNLLNIEKQDLVYNKIEGILKDFGKIKDQTVKHFGLLFVLVYEKMERNLKIEISNRQFQDQYEIKNYLGVSMKVMKIEDMFAHKLAALLDRNMLTNRDVFDIWFFLKQRTMLNKQLLIERTKIELSEYLEKCIKIIEKKTPNKILQGIGDLIDDDLKTWTKNNLLKEKIELLNFYKENPLIIG
jgi:predicted nucleotidyltransferase component of viral defense system